MSGTTRTGPTERLSGADIVLVAAGGAVGTGLRFGLTLSVPPVHGLPMTILIVNVVGALVLGLLLESLAELGPDHALSHRLRLGVGTGVLGGFTTYSTLAVDGVTLALTSPAVALAYGLGTVILGAVASIAGIAAARSLIQPALRSRLVPPC
jgi:CrcB protein